MRILSLLSPDELLASRRLNLDPPVLLTVNANSVTMSQSWHRLSASGTSAQRRLNTINGGESGDFLLLEKDGSSPDNPIIEDEAGNILSAGNFTLNSTRDKIAFIFNGTNWVELFRSNN